MIFVQDVWKIYIIVTNEYSDIDHYCEKYYEYLVFNFFDRKNKNFVAIFFSLPKIFLPFIRFFSFKKYRIFLRCVSLL